MTIYDAGPLAAGPLCGLLAVALPKLAEAHRNSDALGNYRFKRYTTRQQQSKEEDTM